LANHIQNCQKAEIVQQSRIVLAQNTRVFLKLSKRYHAELKLNKLITKTKVTRKTFLENGKST